MNYQEMSDKDISRAVGNILNIEWANFGEHLSPLYFWKNGELDIFDPCESWADAGPIIQKNRITISSLLHATEWDAMCMTSDEDARDKNPLRAAMILFLMMKGGE